MSHLFVLYAVRSTNSVIDLLLNKFTHFVLIHNVFSHFFINKILKVLVSGTFLTLSGKVFHSGAILLLNNFIVLLLLLLVLVWKNSIKILLSGFVIFWTLDGLKLKKCVNYSTYNFFNTIWYPMAKKCYTSEWVVNQITSDSSCLSLSDGSFNKRNLCVKSQSFISY